MPSLVGSEMCIRDSIYSQCLPLSSVAATWIFTYGHSIAKYILLYLANSFGQAVGVLLIFIGTLELSLSLSLSLSFSSPIFVVYKGGLRYGSGGGRQTLRAFTPSSASSSSLSSSISVRFSRARALMYYTVLLHRGTHIVNLLVERKGAIASISIQLILVGSRSKSELVSYS